MIAWILRQVGLDPTFIIGGVLQNLGTNAGAGTGPHLVVEADEYDRTFLGLHPTVAVVTILEHDHPDCYPTFEEMRSAFAEFTQQVVADGLLIVCGEDPEAMRLGLLAERTGRRVVTYGFDRRFDWWAEGTQLGSSAVFSVGRSTSMGNGHGSRNGKVLETCALQVPGSHNVLNALASLAASAELRVDVGAAAAALTRFRGTARRFEIKGQVAGITIVDDYAHHPTEIRATLAAARIKFPGRPIWAVFQPHTYSRTAALLEDFAAAFDDADHVIITGIYAAREQDTLGIGGDAIVDRMHHPDAQFVAGFDDAAERLLGRLSSSDVVITLGAGDGYLIGEKILSQLERGRGSAAEDHG
jgi:UDP-N-acetylmuramate--alanine ligase